MRRIAHIVLWAAMIALSGCNTTDPARMVGVDIEHWSSAATLEYDNCDTTAVRSLNIALRYNDTFKASELPLRIAITTPDSLRYEEAITLELHRPNTALAVATTESLPYRTSVTLNRLGRYTFSFQPLVEVRGMAAIGIEFKTELE
jgi:predicted small secreted protein